MTVGNNTIALACAIVLGLGASCKGGVRVTLTADKPEGAEANGLTPVTLIAQVTPPNAVDAINFGIVTGFGDLSASRVELGADGTATVLLYPPRATDLQDGSAVTTVEASIPLAPGGQQSMSWTRTVSFVMPAQGEPALVVLADPPFVTIGSGETMKLKIEGQYLSSNTVTLTSDSALDLPAELTLRANGPVATAEIEIPTPSEPGDIEITVSGGGAEETVTAHFTAEGGPTFDIDGVFAQVTFGRKRISNYGLLKNDPDCVGADAISLVRIEHVGDQVTMTSESCDIKMPTVEISIVGFDGEITPVATPGFIAATNLNSAPMTFTLDGESFDVPQDQLQPLVIGANLPNPATDELPTDPESEFESDDDGDGNPGVTIPGPFFPVPDTYLCSRTITEEMTGTIESSNVIHGLVTTRSESAVYGGGGDSPTIDDVPSPFHLLRVNGDYGSVDIAGLSGNPNEITCDDVNRFANDLLASFDRPELICD